MVVPEIKIYYEDGKVSHILAVFPDGGTHEILDNDFLDHLNCRLGGKQCGKENKSVTFAKESDDGDNPVTDNVNHPKHYTSHPSGIECIEIARWYDFDIGNAIKYLWRHGLKSEEGKDDLEKAVEDLEKAKWYIDDEIDKMRKK